MLTQFEADWPFRGRVLENFWNGIKLPQDSVYVPNIEITKQKECYEILAQLPGVNSKDLEVQVDGSTLTIQGKIAPAGQAEQKEQKEQKEAKSESESATETETETIFSEIEAFGEFKRVLQLNEKLLDVERIQAEIKDGLLRIRLPFESKAKTVRQIPVSAK